MLAFVGSVQNHITTAGPLVLNYNTAGGGTTGGNCLVACIQAFATAPGAVVSGVTFSGSNADNWQDTGAGGSKASIWIDPDCAGSQQQIVIAAGTSGGTDFQLNAFVMEFSGVALSSPLDRSSTGSMLGSYDSGPTALTQAANEVWVGIGSGDSVSTFTVSGAASPWVNLAPITNSLGTEFTRCIAGYQIATGTGNAEYAGAFTPGGSQDGTATVITLLPAIVAAGNLRSVLRADTQAVQRAASW